MYERIQTAAYITPPMMERKRACSDAFRGTSLECMEDKSESVAIGVGCGFTCDKSMVVANFSMYLSRLTYKPEVVCVISHPMK